MEQETTTGDQELERLKRELEHLRTQHAQEQRRHAAIEAVGDAIDREVAAMLVERTLGSGGVPPMGAELTVAARRAAEGLRRDKPFLFATPGRHGRIAAPEAANADADAKARLQAAATDARLAGDRRSLVEYLSLRTRRA
ncbi:MAG: hypothetical protein WCK33_11685 [Phycisphaerae bacterium]|jgi:hypothetical protein